jgi:DNA-binding MarR family transcriptional regulator
MVVKSTDDLNDFDPAEVRAEAEGRLSRRMLQIYRAFNAMAQQKYSQRGYRGLTAAHTSLMASLERDGLRIVDLAQRMGITKQFAGRLVHELVKIDFVTTHPDPVDRRATLVKGTIQGWKYLIAACEVQIEIEELFKNVLGPEHLTAFTDAIDMLAQLYIDTSTSPEPLDLLLGQDE